ncbi:MAG: alpha/beta fold hydrolase [Solirubrobacterales bacterium]|nr:alpha/beta fold hydrolase [Solirubrobacterales bacterium]MBV9716577.1 alpha/beta fold hydrolase [Solirubrobacterales bacterium]
MRVPPWPPEPPITMPPARIVEVPGRGEFFLRDTGGGGRVVMLLHGWMATADINWWAVYGDLTDAGYRVLAIDHRGHGRGLRSLAPFRIADCAADAAAVLRLLGLAPALVVGYSMGGAIAQTMAREHPDTVAGVVLSATAQHWQDRRTRRAFKALGAMGFSISVAPRLFWGLGLRRLAGRPSRRTVWLESELMRHSARDLAEAGRELGRFDSRPWLGSVRAPIAVLITTRDELVPVFKQRQLAAGAGATVFEAPISHLELGARHTDYGRQLVAALAAVGRREDAAAA